MQSRRGGTGGSVSPGSATAVSAIAFTRATTITNVHRVLGLWMATHHCPMASRLLFYLLRRPRDGHDSHCTGSIASPSTASTTTTSTPTSALVGQNAADLGDVVLSVEARGSGVVLISHLVTKSFATVDELRLLISRRRPDTLTEVQRLRLFIGQGGPEVLSGTLGTNSIASGAVLAVALRSWTDLSLDNHIGAVLCVCVSLDGRLIATGTTRSVIRIYSTGSGALLKSFTAGYSGACVKSLQFTPNGEQLVSASTDEVAFLWSVADTSLVREFPSDGWVTQAVISPDSQFVITVGEDETATVWGLEGGNKLRVLQGHTGWVHCVDITSDGVHVLTGSGDGTVRVWSLERGGDALHVVHTGVANSAVCALNIVIASGGEAMFASASFKENSVRLWTISGTPVHVFHGHTSWVSTLCASADGRLLVSAGNDGTARVWDVRTGVTVQTVTSHTKPITGVCLSSSGQFVLTASADKSVHVEPLQLPPVSEE